MVGGPSVDKQFKILHGLHGRYEQHLEANLRWCLQLQELLTAILAIALPDKAIDLVDEAGSRVRLMNLALPPAAKG